MKNNPYLFFSTVLLLFFGYNLSSQSNALNFDGFDDYVDFGGRFDLDTSDFTIEFWFKADNIVPGINGTGTKILNKGLSQFGFPENAGYGFRLVDTGTDRELRFMVNDGSQLVQPVAGEIDIDTWYHVAGVRNGNTVSLYLDTSLVESIKVDSLGSVNNNLSFALGALIRQPFTTDREFYEGTLDEIRLWNKARTITEIGNDFKFFLDGNEEGLIAYFPAEQGIANGDNGSGCPNTIPCVNKLADESLNTFNGDLVNFALIGFSSNWVDGAPIMEVVSTKDIHSDSFRIGIFPNPANDFLYF